MGVSPRVMIRPRCSSQKYHYPFVSVIAFLRVQPCREIHLHLLVVGEGNLDTKIEIRLKIDMNDRTLTGIVPLGRSFVEPIIGDRIIDALTFM